MTNPMKVVPPVLLEEEPSGFEKMWRTDRGRKFIMITFHAILIALCMSSVVYLWGYTNGLGLINTRTEAWDWAVHWLVPDFIIGWCVLYLFSDLKDHK